ncbi:hypothetical protein ACXZ7E_02590 [Paenibacillus lautus]
MKLEELQSKYPELYDQVVAEATAEAAQAERDRVIALNELSKSPGAAKIVSEAIKDGRTAADVAVEIVNATMLRTPNQSGAPNQGGLYHAKEI